MLHTLLNSNLTLRRLLQIALLCVCTNTQGETWVLTDSTHPVSNTEGYRVVFLDEQHRLEEQLTGRLPSDLSNAATTIQTYLSSPDGIRLQHELTLAQQGVTDAWSLGIKKIPAVVVDRRYVVYGETDASNAVKMIERFWSTEP